MRGDRGIRGPARAGRYARTSGAPAAELVAEAPAATDTPDLGIILAGVKTLLRGRGTVTLLAAGLDLLFDAGVVAKCRACGLSWRVSRSQFSSAGWWSCPSGCRSPRIDGQQP